MRKLLEGIRLTNKPIQKQPNILTKKVATGKGNGSDLTINTDARKRKTLPTAPPAPTNSICFINIPLNLHHYFKDIKICMSFYISSSDYQNTTIILLIVLVILISD